MAENTRSTYIMSERGNVILPDSVWQPDEAKPVPADSANMVHITFIGDSLHWRADAMHSWEPVPGEVQNEMAAEWLRGREAIAERILLDGVLHDAYPEAMR